MKKLKCVGGHFDGRWVRVEDMNSRNECHLLEPREITPPAIDGWVTPDETAETPILHVYTRRVIGHGLEPVVKYLAPADWTDVQAIRHQFRK